MPNSLPLWQRTVIFMVLVGLLAIFAYTCPGWFLGIVVLCLITLHEAHHGPGRDWGDL